MRSYLALWCVLATATAQATVRRVPAEHASIQSAIDAAVPGDTVKVAPGTYYENIWFAGKNIQVRSEGGAGVTHLCPSDSASPVVRFVAGEDRSAVLVGFTIQNPGSRGILCDAASPTIEECDISYCDGSSQQDGGGIQCRYSGALIRQNRIHHNRAYPTGGAIAASGAGPYPLEICGNRIYENYAPHGPGIGCIAPIANVYIHHNTIYRNDGYARAGAGIYINGSDSRIHNNTLVDNFKGIYVWDAAGSGVDIRNNIVVGSRAEALFPAAARFDYNLVWGSVSWNNGGLHGLDADPRFRNAESDDYHLQAHSPCIDAGDPNPIYNDPDGTPNDIGSLPWGAPPVPWPDGDPNRNGISYEVGDIMFLVAYLFYRGPEPPVESVDTNCNRAIDFADVIHMVNVTFRALPPPACL